MAGIIEAYTGIGIPMIGEVVKTGIIQACAEACCGIAPLHPMTFVKGFAETCMILIGK